MNKNIYSRKIKRPNKSSRKTRKQLGGAMKQSPTENKLDNIEQGLDGTKTQRQQDYAKIATHERSAELKSAEARANRDPPKEQEQERTKITLEDVNIPSLIKKRKFEDGTEVETNDKRLERLLSQINDFKGKEITLKGVDLDPVGVEEMHELKKQWGSDVFNTGLESVAILMGGGLTSMFADILNYPQSTPFLNAAKQQLTAYIGLFKFNVGLVLEILDVLLESRNRIKRKQQDSSFDKFNSDDNKKESKIYTTAVEGADTKHATRTTTTPPTKKEWIENKKSQASQKATKAKESPEDKEARLAKEKEVRDTEHLDELSRYDIEKGKKNRELLRNKSKGWFSSSQGGGGGTQLEKDSFSYPDTPTSFFSFENDMSSFDDFLPTTEQASFFKSIGYYDNH